MTTQEAIHKRNLESSILFMQQEHAATLKALHEEIQKLQKKCTGNIFTCEKLTHCYGFVYISSSCRLPFYCKNQSE